jgi:molybdopterin-guanine dinucleotide biosynthesis protein A
MKMSVVIQAGGESRRMGQNKALLPFLGQTLIERVISRIKDIADEVVITSNEPGMFDFLHLPVYPDLVPGRGALGGLYSAFSIANSPLVAVVACDMPFANSSLLNAQMELLIKQKVDGMVPRHENGTEPFHAVYQRETCRLAVKSSLDLGKKRADSWFPVVRMGYIEHEDTLRYDPTGYAFYNLNNPEDYQQAIEIAEGNIMLGRENT